MSVWQNLLEEVGWYLLLLPAYLPVWFGLVKCLQTALRFFFFSFSFLILSLPHDRHGWTLPPPTFSMYFHSSFLFLCAFPAPPPPLLLVIWHFGELPTILPGSLVLLHVCVPVSLFESQTGNLGNIAVFCCCGEGKAGRGLIIRFKRSYKCVQEEGIMSCMCC